MSGDRKALLALAERVENASGPDRDLDAEIALALGWVRDHPGSGLWRAPGEASSHQLPAFTSSLDAARTLVPEGWRVAYLGEWDAEILRARGAWQAILIRPGEGDCFGPDLSPRCNHAAEPALALVAACLRALASAAPGGGA